MKVERLKNVLKNMLLKNVKVPILVTGEPGIGKSYIIKELATELSCELVDIRLAYFLPDDLKGYPFKVEQQKVEFLDAGILPFASSSSHSSSKNKIILFFDEINQAPTATQLAVFQIIHDRCLLNKKLSPDVFIIAACNPAMNFINEMPPALKSRFLIFNLEADYEGFLSYISQKADQEIYSFLTYLHKEDKSMLLNNSEEQEKPINFRVWDNFLSIIPCFSTTEDALLHVFGEKMLNVWNIFKKLYSKLPTVEEILDKNLFFDDVNLQYIANSILFKHLIVNNSDVERFIAYIIQDKRDELAVVFVFNVIKQFKHIVYNIKYKNTNLLDFILTHYNFIKEIL
ncbi:MAG: AAA family ATPase [Candidatus Goldbacteria bacterium]|nr:AAA family ATPase [Candidatus Goldiibacteriota bacterium]